jgi:hypothetical protein
MTLVNSAGAYMVNRQTSIISRLLTLLDWFN